MSVAHRTSLGAAWLIGSRLVTKMIDLVLLMILGRVLGPADFGLVAIAMTLITIVEAILELPLIQGLIRETTLEQGHFDTAFTLALLRGLLLATILAACSWPFAAFYGDRRLLPLIVTLGIAPIARGMISPRMACFNREINFLRDFILETSGRACSFVVALAITLATRSYWGIVAGTVMTPVAMAMLSYLIAPYRPRLSLKKWPVFRSFLGWTTAAQAINAINWQCDRFLLGRLVSRAELGRFSMANDLSALPIQALAIPLIRPLTAGLTHVREDPERLRSAYLKATNTLLLIGLPVMVGLSALAYPAVALILGPRWTGAAEMLQYLALASISALYVYPLGPLATVLDRNDVNFRQCFLEFLVKIPAIVFGILVFGIPGLLTARLFVAVATVLISMVGVRELVGLPLITQIGSAWRTIIAALAMFAILAVLRGLAPNIDYPVALALVLGLAIVAGGVTYLTTLFGLWLAAGRPEGAEAVVVRIARRMAAALSGRLRSRDQQLTSAPFTD